ncbi:hypothetical protein YYC_03335 [Plasmodium yoelii 17X]|uniref:YIR protein n=1 Tax=Plasmodium yoelii 17X TaxID=1323249 RepID=V7PL26_PLAYE|nr:hypothetical protein YYC_03335 [Plasmodium yoelii 17X]
MNDEVSFIKCKRFKNVWEDFPDTLSNGNYQFKSDGHFKPYCAKGCNNNFEKINAGCLYLFDEFFKNSSAFNSVAKNNTNIVGYIMIWLSYMLRLITNESDQSINFFYSTYIKGGEKYRNHIAGVSEYNSYVELIGKKHDLTNVDMNKNIISKLYEEFKILCNMYNEINKQNPDCTKCSEDANKFVDEYQKLFNGNNVEGSLYRQVLCTLSNDYDNFKNKYNESQCSKSSSLPTIEKTKIPLKCSENNFGQFFEVSSSSSSIASSLFIVLSIFAAIAIFCGISYKRKTKKYKEENESLIYDSKINND